MKSLMTSLILLLLLNFAAGQTVTKEAIMDLLPEEDITVTRVEEVFSAETRAVLSKLQASMLEHSSEWMSLVAKTPDGEPVAYQSWFGISEEEYQKVLNPDWTYQAMYNTTLYSTNKILKSGDLYLLSEGGWLPEFSRIWIDLHDKFVVVASGHEMKEVSYFDVNPEAAGEGSLKGGPRRFGYSWHADEYPATTFVIGELPDTNEVFIQYRVQDFHDVFDVTVTFPKSALSR